LGPRRVDVQVWHRCEHWLAALDVGVSVPMNELLIAV
jgi:hypothetical protein